MINDAIATAGLFHHCLWNSRENWNAWVMYSNRFIIIRCDTWAIRLYAITSCIGWYLLFLQGVYKQLSVIMVLLLLWYTLAKSEKQRRWGAVCQWHFHEGFKSKCSFGCMHQAFTRCLVMVQKWFGLTFTKCFWSSWGSGLLFYMVWRAARQEVSRVFFVDRPLVGTIKGGLKS